jgi:hypothetical protein
MTAFKQPALRLPYTQQFSPEQTPISRLLPILRGKAGSTGLRAALASAFFKGKADPDKVAANTISSLRHQGIIDEANALTSFGQELVALQGNDVAAHELLAKRILLEFNGIAVMETLREMQQAGIKVSLNNLPDELGKRGVAAHESSSDLSGILGWLRTAGVLKNYSVVLSEYQKIVGASPETLEASKNLSGEQVAFLRAMVALNVRDWTSYSTIIEHASELFLGEIQYNRKDIVVTVLRPLQSAGLLEFRKQTKQDTTKQEGRGGKAGDVKPTPLFEKEFAAPLLDALYKAAGFHKIRAVRSISLEQIVADIKQKSDLQKSGTALEILAIRLCQMLALDFMGWRETDVEVAGGGEVDAMLHSARLIYSRWQIQCKIGAITLEAVAKEVGMQSVTLANVILLVSTGPATDSAQTFRRKIISKSNLNIIFLDGQDLQRVIKDNSALVEILHKQAQDALSLKPKLTGLNSSPPMQPLDEDNGDDELKKKE